MGPIPSVSARRQRARLSAGLGVAAGIGEMLCHISTYAGNIKNEIIPWVVFWLSEEI
jgi:hypothetical protein